MAMILPVGRDIWGALALGTPLVSVFERLFRGVAEQNAAGAAGIAERGAAARAAGSRDLGQFGPVGGGSARSAPGGAPQLSAPPVPNGGTPTSASMAPQFLSGPPGRGGGSSRGGSPGGGSPGGGSPRSATTPSPQGGQGRGPLLGGRTGNTY